MLKNVTGVKFINAKTINSKRDKNVGRYVYSMDDDVMQTNINVMLKRYRIENVDDLKRFHKDALNYLTRSIIFD